MIKHIAAASFHQKIESVQSNSALAITGAIRARFGNPGKKKMIHKTVLLL